MCVCIIQLSVTDLYENEDLIKPFGPTRDFSDNRQLGNTAVWQRTAELPAVFVGEETSDVCFLFVFEAFFLEINSD